MWYLPGWLISTVLGSPCLETFPPQLFPTSTLGEIVLWVDYSEVEGRKQAGAMAMAMATTNAVYLIISETGQIDRVCKRNSEFGVCGILEVSAR